MSTAGQSSLMDLLETVNLAFIKNFRYFYFVSQHEMGSLDKGLSAVELTSWEVL